MPKKRIRPKYKDRGLTAYQQLTLCWCPKCEQYHKTKLRWIGNGMPRIFCESCRKSKSYTEISEIETHSIPKGELECIR